MRVCWLLSHNAEQVQDGLQPSEFVRPRRVTVELLCEVAIHGKEWWDQMSFCDDSSGFTLIQGRQKTRVGVGQYVGPSAPFFKVGHFLLEPGQQSHSGSVVGSLKQLQAFIEINLREYFDRDHLLDFIRILVLHQGHKPF